MGGCEEAGEQPPVGRGAGIVRWGVGVEGSREGEEKELRVTRDPKPCGQKP